MAAYTTIDDPEAYFQVQLYTGNGSANHAITLGGDTDMQPDFVWIKNRDATDAHCLFDSVRGATKLWNTNQNTAESTDADTLDSFTSDGFQVDADVKVNTNAEDYVAWCWKESATAGFDMVAYTGTGTARTVSHALSAVPTFMFVKDRTTTHRPVVYHQALGNSDILYFDLTVAAADETYWNDTTPTSSVFSVNQDTMNKTDNTYIWYGFTDVQGFSKFGSYEGNGNADGAFVYTGFRPAFVMTKSADSTSSWHLFDNKREGYNVDNDPIEVNEAGVEATTDMIDLLSNGFKFRIATDPNVAETYIYAAFAEAPFVNSNGVPNNAR